MTITAEGERGMVGRLERAVRHARTAYIGPPPPLVDRQIVRAVLEALKCPSNSDHDYFSAATENLPARDLLNADVMFSIVADAILSERTEGEG